ncbi:MAG: HK97 gp10 family phage protein [Ruminococcus flavefaciens]|nr:HK97 gp10 family phage protein [Ruminococcus flavefaciens]MCM1061477.1 HK97 gp10 family phage protein [Eubacterium sp.]
MSDIISPDELVSILAERCKKYTDEIVEKVEEGIENIGMEAVRDIKLLSPVSNGNDKSIPKGAYRRNWTCRMDKERGKYKAIVYVKGKHYRLTHLLENGHLNRDGTSRSKAIPHISIVNEQVHKKVTKLLEDL